jgi:hypothetical protein
MTSDEKALVERLKEKPFALVGIDSDDPKKENIQDELAKDGITWRQALDGSTKGPIDAAWRVNGWPTIYVLDPEGVIRFRGVGAKRDYEAVVEKLLGELEAKK